MSAIDVHPARSSLEQQKLPRAAATPPTTQPPAAPQWINDLMDAAVAGESEFRKEVRAQIQNGKGQELITTIEGLLSRAEGEEAKKTITELLENVKQWVAHPDDLEEGGRFFGRHHRYGGYGGYSSYSSYSGYGGMFGSAFGSSYYPYYGGYGGGLGGFGGYPYGGYGGGFGCYGGYDGWF